MVRKLLLVISAFALLSTTAHARTVSYANIVSPTKAISCIAVKYGSGIECSASYLPDIGELDSYLGLRPRGRARLAERGDYPGYNARSHTVRYGDAWRRPGIRCSMKTSGLTCRNLDGHGFRLARGNIRRF